MQAAGPVELKVYVHYTTPGTFPAQPLCSFGNRYGHFNEREAFPSFRGPGQQHLVPLAQHIIDKWRGQFRKIVPGILHGLWIRQVVVYRLNPFFPFCEVRFAYIGINEILLFPLTHDSRHSAQAGRVFVLGIDIQAIFFAYIIQVIDPLAVFVVISCIDAYNRMETFAAGVYQAGHG